MEYLKKNLTLTISLAVALALAVVLGVKIKQAAGRASEAGDMVEALRNFGENETRAPFSASNANLEISGANFARASREIEKIKMALYARSRVEYNPRVSNTQCKNHLAEQTKMLVAQLRSSANMIQVPQSPAAEGLSFSDVLSSEKLPDEATEVPVLMKQFEIVKEIVRLVALCQVGTLNEISRIGGVGAAVTNDFEVMPLRIRLQGDFGAVKEFLTKLQNDSKYFFVIRNVTLSAPAAASGLPVALRPPAGAVTGAGVAGGAPVPEVPPMEVRRVEFSRNIAADIRFDFVEFKNPVAEN